MNERLVTIASALLALLVIGGLLGGRGPQPVPPPVRAGSQETGVNGWNGAYRWLSASGVRVSRLRDRYTGLDALGLPPTGNLLVVTTQVVHQSRNHELEELASWVKRGNQLLLLGSDAEAFDPALRAGGLHQDSDLAMALGLESEYRRSVADDSEVASPAPDVSHPPAKLVKPEKTPGTTGTPVTECRAPAQEAPALPPPFPACGAPEVVHGTISGPLRRLRPYPPNRAHPVLAGVTEVAVKTPSVKEPPWTTGHADRLFRPLLCDPQGEVPALSLLRAGAGMVWAFEYSHPFSNDNLDRADNARLLSNLVAFSLGPRGAVIFDDMHQGDSVLYDPQAFFHDARLYWTLLFLFGVWMLWLVADTGAFAAPAPREAGVAGLDFVRAQGQFLDRHLRRGEGATELLRRFHDRVRRRRGLPADGQPAWDLVERDPRADAARLAELRKLSGEVERGRRVDLVRLHNLVLHIEGSLK